MDPYGTQYVAVEFKDLKNFENIYGPVNEGEGFERLSHRSLREVSERITDYEAISILAQAVGLNTWHLRTQFCSRCGTEVKAEKAGTVLRCQSENCKASHYPRIEPATMNFITDESNQYTLLGRKSNWPKGRYSCLAGFLEVGETLEQCVMRETKEESGVHVLEDSIRYVGSQPWPFPSSLMIGYRGIACRSKEQEENELPRITYDKTEMEHVSWFSLNDVRAALLDSQDSPGRNSSWSGKERTSDLDQSIKGSLHFPGPSSMARVMLTEWALEGVL